MTLSVYFDLSVLYVPSAYSSFLARSIRDTESLTKCYSKTDGVCFELSQPILFVKTLTFFKATFQHMCAKKDGIAHFAMCMTKTLSDQYGNIMSTCFGSFNADDIVISKCGTLTINNNTPGK
ncbi:Hypothetical predicted protein [Mytilus galloprovincialis]|uniref:Uncharacterized protein n=1 Tax=Mytilus galloprovincialis TaxID=29158 RepID=A0A8B6E817_MYTGA|nr:Hypothetical predicted protein [Mytilus galloprovincialis]